MRIAPVLLTVLAAGVLFMAADRAALSQTKTNPNPSSKPPPAPAAPAGQIPLKGATTEAAPAATDSQPPAPNWSSRCASDGRQSGLDCSVEQSIIETKSRQLVMQVLVRVPPDTRKPVLNIQLPLGIFLPAACYGCVTRRDKTLAKRPSRHWFPPYLILS